ncbi:MAG: Holliday junction branch migration DNA helicase RuvB, partial [Spirochaetales bacterium]|nr:Holliday junction branch migration DNA helicase RuvB [Spirochaetales bacterium]
MIETENNDILSGEIIAEDKKDFALRPQTLDDFQGQKALKDNLRIFLKAAKARGESLD